MKRTDLHKYQNYCVDFLKTHPEAMLILEMGLGKSVITLTAILDLMFDRFEVSKTLVVAPLRVAKTVWPAEGVTWEHARFLNITVMTGTEKQREAALMKSADVYVINRENVSWLVGWFEKHKKPWPFDLLVLDELSSFKNHKSQRWKAIRKIRSYVQYCFGLTGTPAGNGLMDLWAETCLIDGGERLGKFIGPYREAYFRPVCMNTNTGVVYKYGIRPGAEEAIYRKISDISVSMKALDYLDMPECVMVNHYAEMEEEDKALYEKLKEELVISFFTTYSERPKPKGFQGAAAPRSPVETMSRGSCQINAPRSPVETMSRGSCQIYGKPPEVVIDAKNAAVLCGKLLQLSNGAIYTEDHEVVHIHDRKLELLEELIEEANGQNVLVAYWFQHDRNRIRQRFPEARELKTDQDIADWNAGKIQLALISPASAGHGLNIQQGGHILIWFSLIWSLEMYQQTNARLWRQGQKETVTIHHLLTADTIDGDMLAVLKNKDKTQAALIAAVKAHIPEKKEV